MQSNPYLNFVRINQLHEFCFYNFILVIYIRTKFLNGLCCIHVWMDCIRFNHLVYVFLNSGDNHLNLLTAPTIPLFWPFSCIPWSHLAAVHLWAIPSFPSKSCLPFRLDIFLAEPGSPPHVKTAAASHRKYLNPYLLFSSLFSLLLLAEVGENLFSFTLIQIQE